MEHRLTPAARARALLAALSRRPRPSGGALLPALDALRGVAVLAVFAQHLGDTHMPFVRQRVAESAPPALAPWILTVLHHAHWGVDLFFVLSGFSLAQPLLARLSRASPADPAWGRSFAIRRAARIYPAYLAALAAVLVAVPSLLDHPAFPASLAAHLALIQGYHTPGGLALIGAAWSLTTEISFYAAWPLLAPLVLARPGGAAVRGDETGSYTTWINPSLRPWLRGAAIVAVVWLVRAALHEVALSPGAPPWLLESSQRRWAVSRLDQFVLGALAAALHARLTERLRRLAPGALALAVLALPPAFYLDGSFFGQPLGAWPYALVSLATAALVLAAAAIPDGAARWLFPRPLRAIGVISYGVFLNHQLAIGLTLRTAGPPGSFAALGRHAALALALSFALGGASWVLIERPIIERVTARTRKRARSDSVAHARAGRGVSVRPEGDREGKGT